MRDWRVRIIERIFLRYCGCVLLHLTFPWHDPKVSKEVRINPFNSVQTLPCSDSSRELIPISRHIWSLCEGWVCYAQETKVLCRETGDVGSKVKYQNDSAYCLCRNSSLILLTEVQFSTFANSEGILCSMPATRWRELRKVKKFRAIMGLCRRPVGSDPAQRYILNLAKPDTKVDQTSLRAFPKLKGKLWWDCENTIFVRVLCWADCCDGIGKGVSVARGSRWELKIFDTSKSQCLGDECTTVWYIVKCWRLILSECKWNFDIHLWW